MSFWNRKPSPAGGTETPPLGDPSSWIERLRQPRALWRLAVLAALFLCGLLIIQLPRTPLPVHQGERAPHPILSRVDFSFVDRDATVTLRGLVKLGPDNLYNPDLRQVTALRDSLAALVGEIAKAATLDQVPEAARNEWKLDAATFAAVKKALGEKGELLAEVQETVKKSFAPLERPFGLSVVSKEDYQRETDRFKQATEFRNKLPAGLPPEMVPASDTWPAEIQVILPTGEQAVPLKSLILAEQTDSIQARILQLLETELKPVFGEPGEVMMTGVMASRVGPTLVYAAALTENRRVDALKTAPEVRIERKANTTLVEAGKEITDADIELLEQEQKQYFRDLGFVGKTLSWLGAAVIVGVLICVLAAYVYRFQPNVARSFPRSLMLSLLCLVVLGATKSIAQVRGWPELYTFFIATAGLIVTVAYTPTFGLILSWLLIFLVAIGTRADLDWALTAMAGTGVAVLMLGQINNRSRLIKTGALAGLTFAAARGALALWSLHYSDTDVLTNVVWPCFLYFCVGVASGVVMLAILPFIEQVFGITTNMSLLELCNINHPALRRLALEAPGTYTHSLLIGQLAESAANAIGAGGLLARVGAYFHDIGKAGKPHYFGENWQEGERIHDKLPPGTSRQVIMNHVKDGLDMANRLSLPPIIRQFIAEHHGTTVMEFFYHEAEVQAERMGGDPPHDVDYRYPGPKPRSRETAIVMLSDTVEGATRAIKEPTAARVKAIVHEMVMKRLMDGQLDESGLTLSDLHKIEETLTKALLSVYHTRVPYPTDRPVPEAPAEAGTKKEEPGGLKGAWRA